MLLKVAQGLLEAIFDRLEVGLDPKDAKRKVEYLWTIQCMDIIAE